MTRRSKNYSVQVMKDACDAIYFQGPYSTEKRPETQFWSAVHGMVQIDIAFENDHLIQVETYSPGYEWSPGCEADNEDQECKCKFTDELEEWSHILCPHRVLKEVTDGFGTIGLSVPVVDGRITVDAMKSALSNTVHPEFGEESSLVAITKLKWQLLDGKDNPVIFEGFGGTAAGGSGRAVKVSRGGPNP